MDFFLLHLIYIYILYIPEKISENESALLSTIVTLLKARSRSQKKTIVGLPFLENNSSCYIVRVLHRFFFLFGS